MNVVQRIIGKLNEPFPDSGTNLDQVRYCAWASLFVAVFLFVIQPGGMSGPTYFVLLVCVGFGIVSFLTSTTFYLFCRYVLKLRTDIPTWTYGKWVVQSVVMITFIAVGNLIYRNFLDGRPLMSTIGWDEMLVYTWAIGIFPVTFSGLYIQIRALRNNTAAASEFPQGGTFIDESKLPTSSLPSIEVSLNKDEVVEIPIQNFRYLEAMQNYVNYFHVAEGELQCVTVRDTISNIEDQLTDGQFFRCHRSYLVNLASIIDVQGNAQGLKLSLSDVNESTVPVSRSYLKEFRAVMLS
ncbi:MAG: LytTR family DNA-binding domain-containing protein [Pseudomonadota bacterium]